MSPTACKSNFQRKVAGTLEVLLWIFYSVVIPLLLLYKWTPSDLGSSSNVNASNTKNAERRKSFSITTTVCRREYIRHTLIYYLYLKIKRKTSLYPQSHYQSNEKKTKWSTLSFVGKGLKYNRLGLPEWLLWFERILKSQGHIYYLFFINYFNKSYWTLFIS